MRRTRSGVPCLQNQLPVFEKGIAKKLFAQTPSVSQAMTPATAKKKTTQHVEDEKQAYFM